MKRTTKILIAPLVAAISSVAGAIGYFMVVSSYFRKKEQHEENQRVVSNYISDIRRLASNASSTKQGGIPARGTAPHRVTDRNYYPKWGTDHSTPNEWAKYYDTNS